MMPQEGTRCLFCGGPVNHTDHWLHCDGRQGTLEQVITAPVEPIHNVRSTDPETSYRAAFAHLSHRGCQRWTIYQAIIAAGVRGLTDAELAPLVGIQLNSANKRRGELAEKGLVWDSGRRRLTPAGSDAIVWIAVDRNERQA